MEIRECLITLPVTRKSKPKIGRVKPKLKRAESSTPQSRTRYNRYSFALRLRMGKISKEHDSDTNTFVALFRNGYSDFMTFFIMASSA